MLAGYYLLLGLGNQALAAAAAEADPPVESEFPDPAIDAAYAAFGIDADYLPAAGPAVPGIRLLRKSVRADDPLIGQTRMRSGAEMYQVRRSEVLLPLAGDMLTIGGRTRVIQGEPVHDRGRRVWILDTYPA